MREEETGSVGLGAEIDDLDAETVAGAGITQKIRSRGGLWPKWKSALTETRRAAEEPTKSSAPTMLRSAGRRAC